MIRRIILTILPLKPRESEREKEGKSESEREREGKNERKNKVRKTYEDAF
jgi:hypothetical protein